jgi:hypothetical protein
MATPEPPLTDPEAGARSSVKLTRNAKGDTQIEVKVRVGDTEDEVETARRLAVETYENLRGSF